MRLLPYVTGNYYVIQDKYISVTLNESDDYTVDVLVDLLSKALFYNCYAVIVNPATPELMATLAIDYQGINNVMWLDTTGCYGDASIFTGSTTVTNVGDVIYSGEGAPTPDMEPALIFASEEKNYYVMSSLEGRVEVNPLMSPFYEGALTEYPTKVKQLLLNLGITMVAPDQGIVLPENRMVYLRYDEVTNSLIMWAEGWQCPETTGGINIVCNGLVDNNLLGLEVHTIGDYNIFKPFWEESNVIMFGMDDVAIVALTKTDQLMQAVTLLGNYEPEITVIGYTNEGIAITDLLHKE